MTQLSPAAQKVQAAFWEGIQHIENVDEFNLAAALRAVADQVVPVNGSRKNNEIRAELLAIATELEGP